METMLLFIGNNNIDLYRNINIQIKKNVCFEHHNELLRISHLFFPILTYYNKNITCNTLYNIIFYENIYFYTSTNNKFAFFLKSIRLIILVFLLFSLI